MEKKRKVDGFWNIVYVLLSMIYFLKFFVILVIEYGFINKMKKEVFLILLIIMF